MKKIETHKSSIADERYLMHDADVVYRGTIGVDREFNAHLTRDLNTSTFYLFRGISAKYVPARIMHSRNSLSVLKVLILDPRDKRSISLRASDRSKNPKYADAIVEHLALDIREEIFMSIIALFDCRYRCPVEIAYSRGTSVNRLEIFDGALYMSMYHAESASGYPETVRYKKDTALYQLHRLDSFRQCEVAETKVLFNSQTPKSDFIKHLKKLGMSIVDESIIEEYRNHYKAFSTRFVQESKIHDY